MEIPWTSKDQPGAGPAAAVMGSRFELRTAARSPLFLVHSLRLWRQARESAGLMGVSLRAQPLRGMFWTLSAWTDEQALAAFARTDPHARSARRRDETAPAVDEERHVPLLVSAGQRDSEQGVPCRRPVGGRGGPHHRRGTVNRYPERLRHWTLTGHPGLTRRRWRQPEPRSEPPADDRRRPREDDLVAASRTAGPPPAIRWSRPWWRSWPTPRPGTPTRTRPGYRSRAGYLARRSAAGRSRSRTASTGSAGRAGSPRRRSA